MYLPSTKMVGMNQIIEHNIPCIAVQSFQTQYFENVWLARLYTNLWLMNRIFYVESENLVLFFTYFLCK
jgi:hypothetical protein